MLMVGSVGRGANSQQIRHPLVFTLGGVRFSDSVVAMKNQPLPLIDGDLRSRSIHCEWQVKG